MNDEMKLIIDNAPRGLQPKILLMALLSMIGWTLTEVSLKGETVFISFARKTDITYGGSANELP